MKKLREADMAGDEGEGGALPLYSDRILARMTVFSCMLHQRLQVRLDVHFFAVHAVADMPRRVYLTHINCCLCYAALASGASAVKGGVGVRRRGWHITRGIGLK